MAFGDDKDGIRLPLDAHFNNFTMQKSLRNRGFRRKNYLTVGVPLSRHFHFQNIAGIRVNSVSVTKIGMYPYPGKNSGKKCRDKGYFAGIRVCRDKGTPTVIYKLYKIYKSYNITQIPFGECVLGQYLRSPVTTGSVRLGSFSRNCTTQ